MTKLLRGILLMPLLFLMTFNNQSKAQNFHNLQYQYTCTYRENGTYYRIRWNPATPGVKWGLASGYDIDTYNSSTGTWVHQTGSATGGNSSVLEGECDNDVK